MSALSLAALLTEAPDSAELPQSVELLLTEPLAPPTYDNLKKLRQLGLLHADALFALVGQAPIDPTGLAQALLRQIPTGWAFSVIDFTLVRVLARNAQQQVSAALRVDLLSDAVAALVLNQAKQLTVFRSLLTSATPDPLAAVQALCDDALAASVREAANVPASAP